MTIGAGPGTGGTHAGGSTGSGGNWQGWNQRQRWNRRGVGEGGAQSGEGGSAYSAGAGGDDGEPGPCFPDGRHLDEYFEDNSTPLGGGAKTDEDGDIYWHWRFYGAGTDGRLIVELRDGRGVFDDGIAPGTYTLEGDELDYATCGVCIILTAHVRNIDGETMPRDKCTYNLPDVSFDAQIIEGEGGAGGAPADESGGAGGSP